MSFEHGDYNRGMKVLALITLAATALTAQTLTQAERDFLAEHLEKTRAEFLKSISGLTTAQWTFKAGPDRWSIAECAEHITETEDALMGVAKKVLSDGVAAEKRATREADEKLIARVLDRSQKGKAPEILQPKNRWPTPEATKTEFNARRDRTIQYVKETQDDLRGRVSAQAKTDAYQYLLVISSHTARHTAQIEEVKAAANYPK